MSPSLASRIAASFKASFGDIVFGMEDGTVSIFGLVFGVGREHQRLEGGGDLIVLGIARARIGKRRMLSRTLQTLGIAAAAGVAGVLVGQLFT